MGRAGWEVEYGPDARPVEEARGLDRRSDSQWRESPVRREQPVDLDPRQRAYLRGEHVGGVFDVGVRQREERRRSRDASRERKGTASSRSKRTTATSSRRRSQRRRSARLALAGIALLGVMSFAGGFVAMWAAGAAIVGGSAFGGGGGGSWSADIALAMRDDYEVEPLADLLAFRDLSYVPVKAFHWYPYNLERDLDALIQVADQTEINAIVISMKEDWGQISYETDLALAKRYGTAMSNPYITDVQQVVAKLYEHNIVPIARVACFRDNTLARLHPEFAVLDEETGGVFVDTAGHAWLNPYNHDVWEYLVSVAEEVASLGFREIQFDYVRFPTEGIANAVYPGRYCAKEDAIAGFLAFARPRLEALGVWTTADLFGITVKEAGDGAMGQQFEKVSQQVDIVSPMAYPSAFYAGQYGIDYPPNKPYELMTAAMGDMKRRLVGTGAKGRPYLQAYDHTFPGPDVEYTAEMIRAEVQAVEDLGFTEWLLWGGYDVGALRLESTGQYPSTTSNDADGSD